MVKKKKPFRWRKGVAIAVTRGVPTPEPRRRRKRSPPQPDRLPPRVEAALDELLTPKRGFSRMPNRFWTKGANGLWSSQERSANDRAAALRWALPDKLSPQALP